MNARVQILVKGIVQGVGFRPFVHRLAASESLKGRVLNTTEGVLIDLEGEQTSIDRLVATLEARPPAISQIESISRSAISQPANYLDFTIVESDKMGEAIVSISPDIATCSDCLSELFDPANRRFRYPFINCVNCGPRFTIIEDTPYDRVRTTMRDFEMCEECRSEYKNELDRRFHAEPIACSACGPRLFLTDRNGDEIAGDGDEVERAKKLLKSGSILAIKSIGGFHVVCDAVNRDAVKRLRKRKYREDKPFALMANSIEMVSDFCFVSEKAQELVNSETRPIVLLERKPSAALTDAIAPGLGTLGFMLPYAPLHHLLLENLDAPLVFTSGNISDEPICYDDDEARSRLRQIADFFLLHNRRIHTRADDSVVRVFANREMLVRRSRGYAPAPLCLKSAFDKQVLACGAELKNTFCLVRDNHAFISHHIGDLENLETMRAFTQGIAHYQKSFDLKPEIVAYDLHPEYLSTKYALALDERLTKIAVQHHHAHVAACMADNDLEGEVIGVAMDGLGFGSDGMLWGSEFLIADFRDAERVAHLDYVPMPGGAQAIREPWRMAAVYLERALGKPFLDVALPFVKSLDLRKWSTMRRMIATDTNCPQTSSMGRLFDAVASLLGLRSTVNYEGQAAIELEAIADANTEESYRFEIAAGIIKPELVIKQAVEDILEGKSPSVVSAKFHLGVADLIVSIARDLRAERHLNRVALSGGVFQNMFLLKHVCRLLNDENFAVFTHRRVPANDGGISLGQAFVANARVEQGRA